MLFADRCDYPDFGMDKVTNLLYIPNLFGPHLHNEHFIVRLQVFTDCTYDA